MRKVLAVLAIMLCNVSFAQYVTNVDAFQMGDKIVIEYTIVGSQDSSSDVGLSVIPSFSVDGGNSYTTLRSISGDLINVMIGSGKRIEWRVLDDYASFVHSSVIFKVDLKKTQSPGSSYAETSSSQSSLSYKAHASSPQSGEDYYRLGYECEKNKKYADAIKNYRKASELGYKKADERIRALQLHFW